MSLVLPACQADRSVVDGIILSRRRWVVRTDHGANDGDHHP
jgi:hypothetical protein